MRLRDLGPLVVAVDSDEQRVTGSRGAAMLALLIVNANRRVSVDALMDAAWGARVSPGAASTLESHIWRLRQLLEPNRRRRQPPTVLISESGGFRLVASSASLDSMFFAECAGDVRDLVAAGHHVEARARADRALALWRGEPYGAFADSAWAQPSVARLHELRGQLQEERLHALLALGAVEAALSDLPELIAAEPYRESLRGLLMQALYRAGRTEAALDAFQRARQTLLDDVGIDPGAALQTLHARILANDLPRGPADGGAVTAVGGDPARAARHEVPAGPAASARTVEVRLPVTLGGLVGRDQAVGQLVEVVGSGGLVTLTGPAGSGKTRLAVEVARSCAARYPDGVWFVDLAAVSDPELVADVVISTIGFAASAGATLPEDLRAYLRTRRVLLVMDNCEHLLSAVADVVQVALSDETAATACCILATSREPLAVEGETVWTVAPLELPDSTTTTDPTTAPAVALFLRRMTAAAPELPLDREVIDLAVDICWAVDGLPLALELAAARVRSHSLHDIAAQVQTDPSRLSRIGGAPDHRSTVRSAIEWSHRLLDARLQAAHRRLSVLPGPFTSSLAAAVIGDAGSTDGSIDVDDLLAQLVHRSLLDSDATHQPGRTTTFRQLATVRAHAEHALTDHGEAASTADRRDQWVARLLDERPALGSVAEIGWYRTVDDTYSAVRETFTRRLVEDPSSHWARLPQRLGYYWYYRQRLVEGTRWLQTAADLLAGVGSLEEVLAHVGLAAALAVQGRIDLARPHIDAGLDQVAQLTALPQARLVQLGEALVGLVTSAWVPDAFGDVVRIHQRLAEISVQAADPGLALLSDAAGCVALFAAGRIDDALALSAAVEHRAEASENLMARWVAAGTPTIAALLTANPAVGIPAVDRLMATHLRLGSGADGSFLETRANFAAQSGEHAEAVKLYAAAYTETRRAGMVWPRRPLTAQLLALARGQLSAAEYEQQWQRGERLDPDRLDA